MSIPEYEEWIKDPTPENMARTVKALDPVLVSEVQRYAGPKTLMRARAKRLAVKAVKTYDPTKGASLRTWTVTQLKPLSRYGQRIRPVQSSEARFRQAAELRDQQQRLHDELGRLPTDTELADRMGVSMTRLKRLRDQSRPLLPESGLIDPETGEGLLPAVDVPSRAGSAAEAVYSGLNDREKAIFDMKTGMHGQKALSNQEIARRLGVTPALVSQISGRISKQIQETASVL